MWYLRYHIRRIIRSFMKPMDPVLAQRWLIRVRIMYVCSGIAAFTLSYFVYRQNRVQIEETKNLDTTSTHRMVRLRGEPGRVKITRFSFANGIETYDYNNEDYIKEYNQRLKQREEQEQSQTTDIAQVN